jgi:hypothetical protein
MSVGPLRTTIACMTNHSLTSAIAAEHRRDLHAAAAHSRLVREATTTTPSGSARPAPTGLRGLIRRTLPA